MGKQLGRMNASIRSKREQPEILTQREGEDTMETDKTAYRVVITIVLESGRKIRNRITVLTTDIDRTVEHINHVIMKAVISGDGWISLRYSDLFCEECDTSDACGYINVLHRQFIGYTIETFAIHPFVEKIISNK